MIYIVSLSGLGYGMVCVSAICSMYYNVILSWALFYLLNSFRSELPWATCDNDWNTEQCVSAIAQVVEMEEEKGNETMREYIHSKIREKCILVERFIQKVPNDLYLNAINH